MRRTKYGKTLAQWLRKRYKKKLDQENLPEVWPALYEARHINRLGRYTPCLLNLARRIQAKGDYAAAFNLLWPRLTKLRVQQLAHRPKARLKHYR